MRITIAKSVILAAFGATTAASPVSAQLLAAPVGTLGSVVTPGIVGDTAQVGVGHTRVGAVNGLAGKQGTPTTKVGVNLLTQDHPPQGSVATVGVPPSAARSLLPR